MAALSKPAEALVLLLFFLPFLSCFAASSRIEQLTSLSGGGLQDGIFLPRRSAAEAPPADVVVVDNSSFVLAAPRTHRKDPLDGFHRYTGGWNISEKHYWASVGYTAAPLFAIALAWFIGFGLVLLFICCWFFCCRRRSYSYSRAAYALSLILLVLFTCAAIIGCVVLYTGQGKFHRSTYSTMDYVVGQANFTVENLRNFSDSLSDAKKITVDQVLLPSNVRADIDVIAARVNKSATQLADRTSDNSRKIRRVLDRVRLDLIIIAAVMLLLAFIGFLLSILGLQYIVSILVVVGWILVTGTFILCGVFLILHNVVADSCVAMNEWVDHPYAHTALDDILPCVDVATANESLTRSREVTFQLVNVVNQVIANISNGNFPPQLKPLYFNQTGPLMPLLCNPYMLDLNNRPCFLGEVDFNNATQVWKGYVCQTMTESGSEVCTTVGRVTPSIYNQMAAAVNVSRGLYLYVPFLTQLEDCTFVRDTFTGISQNNCPDLESNSKLVYIGLVMVSAAVMLSLIFWVIYARERRHRKYNKQFVVGSGQPMPQEKAP
ncbi:uncharacterized protein LOC122043365 [Zingiber officinale]|uniref:Uncharacterized protein n=1 Tax=Zingiber officinale TaxID=94328 RepID=A0A8J5HL15_ZINOF|nr:uncharacterized protein LOC122043365 [Zingiber officinale]KAG6530499.1 hypothetical protein ZIOFF_012738 [Zingiber officinale]